MCTLHSSARSPRATGQRTHPPRDFLFALANKNDYHFVMSFFHSGVIMKKLVLALLLLPATGIAAAPLELGLSIKDQRFTPAELKVPAGQKVKLVVSNLDSTPEEFESHSLNREKLIAGQGKATVYVGPLAPGRYAFFGEFNENTARGVMVAE